jgi:hypothetical protein
VKVLWGSDEVFKKKKKKKKKGSMCMVSCNVVSLIEDSKMLSL